MYEKSIIIPIFEDFTAKNVHNCVIVFTQCKLIILREHLQKHMHKCTRIPPESFIIKFILKYNLCRRLFFYLLRCLCLIRPVTENIFDLDQIKSLMYIQSKKRFYHIFKCLRHVLLNHNIKCALEIKPAS